MKNFQHIALVLHCLIVTYFREKVILEQVYSFDQKSILKGTKFRENCQNTDLYQETASLNWHSCFKLSKQ